MKILIAEDSTTSRKLLKGILQKMEFTVTEAIDGSDAWEKLQEETPPRIAIIDWLMPNLNGIELVKKIRKQEKETNKYTYIIMVTSNSEEKDANLGFDAGVDNFLTKPVDPNRLSITLRIAKRIIGQQEYLNGIQFKLGQQLLKQKEEIKRAQEIQKILNTSVLPQSESVNIRAVYNPSQEMGGDFFNIVNTIRGNIAVIMVDCTGHGLEASMYATLLKSVCDRHIYLLDNPKYLNSFIQMVNIDVSGYITSDQFPVMFASIYEPETKKFYYSSANGEHPYLIRNNSVYKLARVQGMHLGYNTESQYFIKSFQVNPEDIILFYSDAIIEIDNASWDRHDDRILRKILTNTGKNLSEFNSNLMNFIEETSGSTTLEDDLSLIYFQIKDPVHHHSIIESKGQMFTEIEVLEKQLYEFDYSWDDIQKISIAYKELIVNSLDHGCVDSNSLKATLDYQINCNKVILSVEDDGCGFDPEDIPDPTDLNRLEELLKNNKEEEYTHGRGIWLANNLADEVIFSCGGRKATINHNKSKIYTSNNYVSPIDNK